MMHFGELKETVDRFFTDKSRSRAETKDDLETLRDEIEVMIESLEDAEDSEDEEDGE